jgi:hypothetical protein
VESSQCEQTPAHRYQNTTYHLCKRATNSATEGWTLCDNISGRDGQQVVDMGSRRTTPCPVCTESSKAEADYQRASQVALAEYTRAMSVALDMKHTREDKSMNQIRYIPRVSSCLILATAMAELLTDIATPLT